MSVRDPAQVAALLASAEVFWRSKGQRTTVVRRIVSRHALSSLEPFDAEGLLAAVRVEDRAVSLASVYRALADLVAAGLLRAMAGGPGERHHYVVADTPAAGLSHIVCTDCEQVLPLADPCLPLREGALARGQGFTPRSMSLRVEASCDQFHATGVCPRNSPAPKAKP